MAWTLTSPEKPLVSYAMTSNSRCFVVNCVVKSFGRLPGAATTHARTFTDRPSLGGWVVLARVDVGRAPWLPDKVVVRPRPGGHVFSSVCHFFVVEIRIRQVKESEQRRFAYRTSSLRVLHVVRVQAHSTLSSLQRVASELPPGFLEQSLSRTRPVQRPAPPKESRRRPMSNHHHHHPYP